jgi:IPT/TIG domain-containing protein
MAVRTGRRATSLGFVLVAALIAAVVAVLMPRESTSAPPPSSTVHFVVRDAKTHAVLPNFLWQVTLDNSHAHPSVEAGNTYSPVVANGSEADSTVSLPDTEAPDRGYLVSIFANDGLANDGTPKSRYEPDYKLGGAHFTLPVDAGDVVVELQPNPLPLAALKVLVFHDNSPVNATEDVPVEEGLKGFHVILHDPIGEVVTDWYGNPLCTQYERDPGTGKVILDADGSPTPIAGTGFCLTDDTGYVSIPNLGPDRYEVQAIPPDGSDWIQVTTIEGSPAIDAWIQEGNKGFGLEKDLLPSPVWFGFTHACQFGNLSDDCTSATANAIGKTGSITGRVRSLTLDTDAPGPVDLGNVVTRPYLALSNIGGNDEQVWTGRGAANGTFTIPDVPAGLYQLAVWDKPLDYIIQFFTVNVTKDDCVGDLTACKVDLGDIGVPRWWGTIKGSVFVDQNENGVRDPGEVGLPNQDLDTRYKDGTIQYATFADKQGNYEFPEVFELEHFAIAEVGYGRFKNTGAAAYATDDRGNPVDYPWVNDCTDIDGHAVTPCTTGTAVRECTDAADWRTCEHGPINQDLGLAGLLQAEITWAGLTTYIDWGKKSFAPGENGGIVGIVFNDATRNELDAALEAAEDYEPGIPGVTVNLYAPKLDAAGDPLYDPVTGEVQKDHLANTYVTDSYYDARPADCTPIGSIGRTPEQVQPYPAIWDNCIELPALFNQTRPGVFDGGYAFEDDCSTTLAEPNGDADGDGTPNRFDPDLLSGACEPVAAGKWVVDVELPAGYKVVKEEDINVFGGDQFVPAVPPPPCAGPLHTVNVVDDAADAHFDAASPWSTQGVYNPDFLATTGPLSPDGGSPYEGERMPLCNERLITLQEGFNANSDFFVFTDVPAPGRMRGLLLDDLNVEFDPSSPMYAEKRGIPNSPIGILDFTGKEVTRTMSDENGYWEVVLPSTGTYNCPLPAGPCPAVYEVVGNYPGTPDNPTHWNPNYAPLSLNFEVWPGLTTVADVATLPITGFVQNPGSQFQTPPVCDVPATTPDVRSLSQPYGRATDAGSFTISGSGFGATQGSGKVTLDGTALAVGSWSANAITVPMASLGAVAPGPHQLLVKASNDAIGPTGITFHVLGAGYDPVLRQVGPSQTYTTIQSALDAANDGDLVLVHPGVYYENIIIDEKLKLQGYGPGVTTIDGHFFNFQGMTSAEFAAKVAGLAYDGPASVPQGQAVTVLAENGEFGAASNAQIDGFAITSGTGVERTGIADKQGGAIYAHAYARYLQISNNVIESSAGIQGGGIILGRPYVDNPDAGNARDLENDFVKIDHNRVLNNGGVRLAGGIALFNGANGFSIEQNVICGNYSAEYGGGISLFGKSSGSIRGNEILFNYAFDEGGGIMIAGEEPQTISQLSAGTGDVSIERNRIQGNVSNDDGGGIRLLTPVAGRISIVNNMVVNNLATDSGGGLSLDDALDVRIVNNTIAKNVSTATAEDADRTSCDPAPNATCPHGAGLVSEGHSTALLDAISDEAFDCDAVNCTSEFTDPVLFNNVLWKNEAFHLDGSIGLLGGGLPSDGYQDLEVLDPTAGHFNAAHGICTTLTADCPGSSDNAAVDPKFIQEIATNFQALAFAGDPSFVTVLLKSTPADPPGDYHLLASSPAVDAGALSSGGVNAPADDFDGDARPLGTAPDAGADERLGSPPPSPPLPLPPLPPGPSTIDVTYLSLANGGTFHGVAYADEDIVSWNGTSAEMVFDGSDVGLGAVDLDAFAFIDGNSLLLSFDAPRTIAGFGLVDDSDIVRFDASSLGATTAGTFRRYVDGSDVGLTRDSEDIDAIELRRGQIVVSTRGEVKVPRALEARAQDLLVFRPSRLGPLTAGTWRLYFDGSDVGLTTRGENVDAATLANGRILLSTSGGFSVPGVTGANEDLVACQPTHLGPTTSCAWSAALAFDGSAHGLAGNNVDAVEWRRLPVAAKAQQRSVG